MKQNSCPRTTNRNLAHISLVVFLTILLLQSAVGLFVSLPTDSDSIDIVFRTAISSIFGYLMSSIGGKITSATEDTASQPRTIGFSGDSGTISALEQSATTSKKSVSPPSGWSAAHLQFQTITIAALGCFCLLILIALRYCEGAVSATSGVIATVAQYRDIISGSIGALIGLARGHAQ